MKNKNNHSDTILKVLKSLGLIILLVSYSIIPVIIFFIMGINYYDLSFSIKILSLFIADILFVFFLGFIYRDVLKKDFKKLRKDFFGIIKIAIKYWLEALFFMIICNAIISIITGGDIASNEKSVRELLKITPIFMLFQIAIFAPFTEELIFRKSIRDIFKNDKIYVLISGLVFGGMHVVGDMSYYSLLYIIPYGVLGGFFAQLYRKTDNIYSSMIVHSIHNTMAFLLLIIAKVI
ncbi:MAG: type II CAAX endopeptidase family protein [Bacilli bacterium]|nr:type II CAAX endopeptidase family protein [Bacilli bacterium]